MNNKLSVLALAVALMTLPCLGQVEPGVEKRLAGFRYFLEHWTENGAAAAEKDRRAAHQLQFAIGEASDMAVVKSLTPKLSTRLSVTKVPTILIRTTASQ